MNEHTMLRKTQLAGALRHRNIRNASFNGSSLSDGEHSSMAQRVAHLCEAQQWQHMQQHAMPEQQRSRKQEIAFDDMTCLQQQAYTLLQQLDPQYAAVAVQSGGHSASNLHTHLAADRASARSSTMQQQSTQHGMHALSESPAAQRLHKMQHDGLRSGSLLYSNAASQIAVPGSLDFDMQQNAALPSLSPHTPEQQAHGPFQRQGEATSTDSRTDSHKGQGMLQNQGLLQKKGSSSRGKGKGSSGKQGQGKERGISKVQGSSVIKR